MRVVGLSWNRQILNRIAAIALSIAMSIGTLSFSPPANAAVGQLTAPVNLNVTPYPLSLAISWNQPLELGGETITGYQVEYSTDGSNWTTATTSLSAASFSHTISGLSSSTSYYVRVAAKSASGLGAYGYPWTEIFRTYQPWRTGGAYGTIEYEPGYGLSGGQASTYNGSNFTRVRYRIGAVVGGAEQYVDANFSSSMTNRVSDDSYTSIYRLQVPVTSAGSYDSTFELHGNVTDLNIQSNVAGVIDGKEMTGRLEIWPWDYGMSPATGLSGGSNNSALYDDGDFYTVTAGYYGSFQLHNITTGSLQTAFAWNRHYGTSQSSTEVGFGSWTGGNPDWTFCASSCPAKTSFSFQSYANIPIAPQAGYTVTFNANDGSGTTGTQMVAPSTSTQLTAPNFSRSNHVLTGWNTEALGGGTGYGLTDSVSISAPLTLYAVWEPTSTLTFDYQSADGGSRPATLTYQPSQGAITLPTPTKTGDLFAGWYSDAGFSQFAGRAGESYSPSSSQTLYAKWTNLLVNLDGADLNSLPANATTWTSVLPGASTIVGTRYNATYYSNSENSGFSFDGTTDAIEFPVGSAGITGQMTLETWVNPGDLREGWNIIASRWFGDRAGTGGSGANDWHFAIYRTGNSAVLNLYTSGLSNSNGTHTFPLMGTDTWYHLGFTIDASDNLQFFVNGQADGPTIAGASHTNPAGALLWLGDGRTSSALGFIGKISKFRLYNKALSTSVLEANFEAEKSQFGYVGDSTVTFSTGNHGAGSNQTVTKTGGTNLVLPNSATANSYFTRAGYQVTGWSLSSDGSTVDFALSGEYSDEEDVTLYPVWTANTFTVTYSYDSADGGVRPVDAEFTYGGSSLTLPTPTKFGYSFAGWFENAGLTVSAGAAGADYSPTQNITLYAKWTGNNNTVTFVSNFSGGESDATQTIVSGVSTALRSNSFSRTGYTFTGWSENNDGSGTNYSDGDSVTLNNALTLYAKWEPVDYTLTYHPNIEISGIEYPATAGLVPVNSNSYNIGESAPVAANSGSLERTGYTFLGWVTNLDGSGTPLNSGETIAFGSANIDLYPSWSPNTYTVSYHLNGGAGDLAGAPTSWEVGTPNLALPTAGFTKEGYTFAGWSLSPTGAAESNSFFTLSDVTLYAKWSIKSISYTFDKGTAIGETIGGWPTNGTSNFGTTITLPSLTGVQVTLDSGTYSFFGWKLGDTVYNSGDSFVLGESSPTFVAQWVRLFDVRYAFAGGTDSALAGDGALECDTAGLCEDDESIVLRSAPERPGYEFAGWKIQNSQVVAEAGATVNISATSYLFYAQWTPINYSFTFNTMGGSAIVLSTTKNIGQLVTMPNPGSKLGHSFAGWQASGSTDLIGVGSTYLVGTEAKAFVAQWTPDVYTVVFDWQGATGTPVANANYTYGTGDLTLPSLGDRVLDGYAFVGWSTSPTGSVLTSFSPTSNDILYAIWTDGAYTLSYDGQGATSGSGSGTIGRGGSVTLPTPVREGFTFLGWHDSILGGTNLGNGGDSFTPTASTSLYARWIQNSLFGVDEDLLEAANEYTASDSTSIDTTLTHVSSNTSARIQVPAGALPNGTRMTVRYFRDATRQQNLISNANSYIFSILVSWTLGTGTSATVPETSAGKPIEVTLTNSSIKAGAMVYMVVGDEVTELGRATEDGTVTVELTQDPEIVVAATVPEAPTGVSAVATNAQATISFSAPSNGGSDIIDYTVTASPGGATCITSSTICTITGLTNALSYTFSVVARNGVGYSLASTSSSSVTPALQNFVVSFNSEGGSTVSNGSFVEGGSISAPSNPTKSGFDFIGWSTVSEDADEVVTFPYSPSNAAAITLYAIWEVASVLVSPGNSSSVTPPVTPSPGGEEIASVSNQTRVWTKRISNNQVKVYIKYPELGSRYQIMLQKNDRSYSEKMSKTVTSTSDSSLLVVNGWYYLVRTITLPGAGKYRIQVLEDGQRAELNGENRPAVYSYF